MVDDNIERVLWWWTIPELLMFLVLFLLLVASLFGSSGLFNSYSRGIRLFGLVVALFQFTAPVWVYYDLRTHSESPDMIWFHIAAMPAINLVGVLAYLKERSES